MFYLVYYKTYFKNLLSHAFIYVVIGLEFRYINNAQHEPQPGDVTVSTGLRLALVAAEW